MLIRVLAAGACTIAAVLTTVAPATSATSTPTALRGVSSTATSIRLGWHAAPGARAYRVQAATNPGMRSASLHRFARNSGVVAGLRPSTRYYFRVAVLNPVTHQRVSAYSARGRAFPSYVTKARAVADVPAPVVAPAPAPTPPPVTVTPGPYDLRVGSYNIQSVAVDKLDGDRHPWADRRLGVIANVLGENVDVMGVQEANQGYSYRTRVVGGASQILDLRNGLNSHGRAYALTDTAPYNCVNPSIFVNCVFKDQGAAGGDSILYNTDTLTMLSHGSYLYKTQKATGYGARYLTYATFEVRSTGIRFFFTSTHLDGDRATEWREVVQQVNSLKGSLPVVNVGDYNTQKYDPLAAQLLPGMKNNGYGDVLNQEYRQNPIQHPRARTTVNGYLYSFNYGTRDVHRFACSSTSKTGNNIDQIFATNALKVKEFKVVVDYDRASMTVNGILPSDHNMIRATLTLP